MKIHPNLQEVMEQQYYQKGEGPDDMLIRVAKYVAGAERLYGWDEQQIEQLAFKYFQTLSQGYWMCSSPFLMNAGTQTPMLSACFVLGIEDEMTSIFGTLYDAAMVHKSGGGTGFDLSKLRSKGSTIGTTGGVASGPLSFLRLYDLESDVVKQGGRRRAANMGALRIDHPDILEFIDAKRDKSKFTNFNLSVIIPNWFMGAVESGLNYPLKDHKGIEVGRLEAKEVFDKIIQNNWESGEPGVLFIDNMNAGNKLLHLGEISVTNPCGEVPLLPWEACTLASINLDKIVKDGTIDWDTLDDLVRLVVRFLDSSIDVNQFPLQKITDGVKRTRKIGLGIMGLHGMLIKLGIPYDSEKGLETTEGVIGFIARTALLESRKLAKEKGVPDGWYGSDYEKLGIAVRNLTRISIAPTGTISMIIDSSSPGAEPMFAIVYERTTRDKKYLWINSLFKEIAEREGFWTENLIGKIIDNGGRVTGLIGVPDKWQRLFRTAGEIAPEMHVRMQGALQKYVDNGISKTVNIPHNASVDDIREAYLLAHKLGCKGITVYRDGSREGVLNLVKKSDSQANPDPKLERPEVLIGATMKVQSGCGKLWVTINPYKGRPWEVFASSGSDGGCTSNIQEIARLSSLLFRESVDVEKVLDQLRSVKCAHAIASKCGVKSCSDAIAKQIEKFMKIYQEGKWEELLSQINNPPKKEDSVTYEYSSADISFLEDINKQTGCRDGHCG
jgi:ribonucleoside-diphosphate reductase alpha chain